MKKKIVLFSGNVSLGLNTLDQGTLVLRTATSKPRQLIVTVNLREEDLGIFL